MADKKSFVLFTDRKEQIDMLTDEQAGKLIKAIFEYVSTETEQEFEDFSLRLLFSVFKAQIDENMKKYEIACKKRSENAKKRWTKQQNANAYNCMQTDAFTGDTDTYTGTETYTETGTGTETYNIASPDKSGKSPLPPKLSFGEYNHIKLTQNELDALCSEFSEQTIREYIQKMDEWIQINGKKPYKDSNLALRKWLKSDNICKKGEMHERVFRCVDPDDEPF